MDLISYWQHHVSPYLRARFGGDEEGASLVEYALLVALIAIVCIVAIGQAGQAVVGVFGDIAAAI